MAMTDMKILKELSRKGFLDYKFLSLKGSIAEYPSILGELLKKAEQSFNGILQLKNDRVNFTNVVEYSFTHDHDLGSLYAFLTSLDNTNSAPATRKIIERFEPKMVDYYHKTALNKDYYALLKRVSRQELTPDQRRSVFLLLRNMRIAGIDLPDDKRKILKKINKDLSKISQKFRNNIIDGKKQFFHEFKDGTALGEMPRSELDLAAAEAKTRKSGAAYVFTLSPPSLRAILKYCSDRSIRELFYKKSLTVACAGKYDNRPLVKKILELRREKSKLLGFKNYADFILQERMAKSTRQIESLLAKVFRKSRLKAQKEIRELAAFSELNKMEEWDVSYYSEKLKRKKFQVEEKELKEYFPLDQVINGLFTVVSLLFDVEMKPKKVESYHPDLRVFEVRRKKELLAYYIADFTARPTKKNGAWCDLLRSPVYTGGGYEVPTVINVMNFPQASGKQPALLSHRDVETLFHEFGHALHVIFSSKTYANLNGFSTEWDFVEFPSQLLENWCWEMDSLRLFAKHYKTGKVLPPGLIQKLRASKTFMGGYSTLRQLEFALLDLGLHTGKVSSSVAMLDRTCRNITGRCSVLPKFKGYSMYTSFDHVFAGGYAAGYYSYIWAEILEADVFLKMKKMGILKRKTGLGYAHKVLAPGAKKEGMAIFRDFMGRNPDVGAFIRKHDLG